jgi:predicted HTH transcriptional regulator
VASDAELDELAALISAESETQEESTNPGWTWPPAEARAEIAKDSAALANHGGGYLIFGIDDDRKQQGACAYDLATFGEEPLTDVVRTYLDPPFQVRVRMVSHDGHEYPVAIVPSHGARPVIPRRNGPEVGKVLHLPLPSLALSALPSRPCCAVAPSS